MEKVKEIFEKTVKMEKVKEILEETKKKIEKEKNEKVNVLFLVVTEHKGVNQVEVDSLVSGDYELLAFGLDKAIDSIENQ